MNKQKWLIVGLSLAMAASLGVGISACGGDKDPDTPPTPTEHTHTYDAWDYNETQHWKYCDEHGTDKSNIDESTKANHSFGQDGKCECGAVRWEMYVVGKITSYPGSMIPTLYSKQGLKISEEVPKNCPKMTLSEDGKTYTAEVYLVPADYFGVYSLTTGAEYPVGLSLANKGPVLGVTLQVEEANTYLISWKIGEAKPTVRVHDHKYTQWQYDADQHWKVCPTDGAVDPTPKAGHSYDPETHECECGAVETVSCEHSKGYAFDYSELPAAEADGGTLQKTCPDCGDTQDVTYLKGFTGDGDGFELGTIGEISVGTYYFTTGNKYQTLGMKITEAGTYTLTFEEVFDSNSEDGRLVISALAFSTNNYSTMLSVPFAAIAVGAVSPAKKADLTTYAVQVNGVTPTNESLKRDDIVTLSFTVTEEQLQAGDLCVSIHLRGGLPPLTAASVPRDAVENSLSHLVTVTKSAAEANVAPAEVAMLPEKKD